LRHCREITDTDDVIVGLWWDVSKHVVIEHTETSCFYLLILEKKKRLACHSFEVWFSGTFKSVSLSNFEFKILEEFLKCLPHAVCQCIAASHHNAVTRWWNFVWCTANGNTLFDLLLTISNFATTGQQPVIRVDLISANTLFYRYSIGSK